MPVSKALLAGCLSVLLMLPGMGIMASERPVLSIGYIGFPPLQYQDENGEPAGTMIDLTRMVAEEAGFELKFTYLPTSRAYLYLRTGAIDLMLGLTNVPELADFVVESSTSPVAIQLFAWSRGDTPSISNFEQLEGRLVILIAGYTYGGLLRYLEASSTIRVTHAPNHLAALKMLRLNRGDYLLDYRQPIFKILKTRPMDDLNESEIRTRYGAWLFSRSNPKVEHLRNAFDEAYLRLLIQGEVPVPVVKQDDYLINGYPSAN